MIVLIFSQTECKYIAFILIKKHLHDFFQKNVIFLPFFCRFFDNGFYFSNAHVPADYFSGFIN